MKTPRLAPLGVVLAIAGAAQAAPQFIGHQSAYDNLLVTPAPYPANKVDDVARPANSREFVSRFPVGSRTPVDEQQYGFPGRAWYGASAEDAATVIYVRVNHVSVAIDPWTRIDSDAAGNVLCQMELARQVCLRENGYTERVRTFRNSLYFGEEGGYATAVHTTLPTPRATIQVNDEMPDRPEKMRVQGPPTLLVDEPAPAVASGE